MESGYCLYLPRLTMVVLHASQMEQVVMSSLMDQGTIQAMKANYRKSMLHSLLAAVGKFNIATEFAKSVTVFDAIRWISSVWNNAREETILKYEYFRRAGFGTYLCKLTTCLCWPLFQERSVVNLDRFRCILSYMITCRTFKIQISDILLKDIHLFNEIQDDLMYQGKTVLYSNLYISSDYVNW